MNKKILLIGFICVCLLLPAWAARHAYYPSAPAEGLGQGTAMMSSQIAWQVLDATTVANAEPDDLAVTERTYLTVLEAIADSVAAGDADTDPNDEISVVRIPPTWNTVRFRCIGASDGGAITHQIYFGTLGNGTDCELSKAGQLAWVIGSQVSTTTDYELADTLVLTTSSSWNKTWGSQSPTGNLVAEAVIDVLGADLIVIVTTVTDVNCKLLAKGV